jgi:hypothetical protein
MQRKSAYVDDMDEARKLFVEELLSSLQVIALDAKSRWISIAMWPHRNSLGFRIASIAPNNLSPISRYSLSR